MRQFFTPGLRLAAIAAALLVLPLAAFGAGTQDYYIPIAQRAASASNNLDVSTATYLGGAGDDQAAGVDVAPDGSVVLGATLPGGFVPGGVTPVTLPGGGAGVVLRFAADGRSLRSVTRVGADVSDLEVSDDGTIVVCGGFGVAALAPDAASARWSANPGAVSRCAIGADGTVAALTGGSIHVYGVGGAALGAWSAGNAADVALDGAGKRVIASGFTQKNVSGSCMGQLQVAFMRGWAYNGTPAWTSYDWTAQQAQAANVCADTRALRVAIGRDGRLYMAGVSYGGTGASIFARDPKDIALKPGSDRIVVGDKYTNPYNINGAAPITWYGRYNPADGALLQGASLLGRLSSGKGNGLSPRAISADERGTIFLAGDAACCIENRDTRQVAGVTVGGYESGEGFVAVISADMTTRSSWTPFAAPGATAGGSPAIGVAARGGTAATALQFNLKSGATRALITANALQPRQGGGADAYLAVWRP